ncbi:MAG TPA: NfeD family protein [Dictyoglomaceae bacterium]|nr:NfeD family protein [Dictyoglomaceae bacterium]
MKKKLLVLILMLFIISTSFSQQNVGVCVIPIKGTIELGLSAFVERSIREHSGAKAFIFEIDTFGGRVDAATKIRDVILEAPSLTIAFIKDRAWSAGALIALSCEKIIISPSGSIGAAEPRPAEEKEISALRAEFESTAKKRGRDPKIAGGMVDASVVIPGLKEKGKILTLYAEEAKKWKIADEILPDRESLLKYFKLENEKIIELYPTWSENFVRFITDPTVSSIILTVGMLGLYVAIFTPGLGIPEILALTGLGLFFGGHYLAGLAGLEPVILFLIGLLLLFIEMHTPGFGIPGIAGSISIFLSVYWTIVQKGGMLQAILTGIFVVASLIIFLIFYLPRSRVWRTLNIPKDQKKDLGYTAVKERTDLLDKKGITLTMLRPTGFVEIDGEKLEVYAESEFIEPNVEVVVFKVEGNKIFVRRSEK